MFRHALWKRHTIGEASIWFKVLHAKYISSIQSSNYLLHASKHLSTARCLHSMSDKHMNHNVSKTSQTSTDVEISKLLKACDSWRQTESIFYEFSEAMEAKHYRFIFSSTVKRNNVRDLRAIGRSRSFRDMVTHCARTLHYNRNVPAYVWAGIIQHVDNIAVPNPRLQRCVGSLLKMSDRYSDDISSLTPAYFSGTARAIANLKKICPETDTSQFWKSCVSKIREHIGFASHQWQIRDAAEMLKAVITSGVDVPGSSSACLSLLNFIQAEIRLKNRQKVLCSDSMMVSLLYSCSDLQLYQPQSLDSEALREVALRTLCACVAVLVPKLDSLTPQQFVICVSKLSKLSAHTDFSHQPTIKNMLSRAAQSGALRVQNTLANSYKLQSSSRQIAEGIHSFSLPQLSHICSAFVRARQPAPHFFAAVSEHITPMIRDWASVCSSDPSMFSQLQKRGISVKDIARLMIAFVEAGEPAPALLLHGSRLLQAHKYDEYALKGVTFGRSASGDGNDSGTSRSKAHAKGISKRPEYTAAQQAGWVLTPTGLVNVLEAIVHTGIPAVSFLELSSVRFMGLARGSIARWSAALPQPFKSIATSIRNGKVGSSESFRTIIEKYLGSISEPCEDKSAVNMAERISLSSSHLTGALLPSQAVTILWFSASREMWSNYGCAQRLFEYLSLASLFSDESSRSHIADTSGIAVDLPEHFTLGPHDIKTLQRLWLVLLAHKYLSPWPELVSHRVSVPLKRLAASAASAANGLPVDDLMVLLDDSTSPEKLLNVHAKHNIPIRSDIVPQSDEENWSLTAIFRRTIGDLLSPAQEMTNKDDTIETSQTGMFGVSMAWAVGDEDNEQRDTMHTSPDSMVASSEAAVMQSIVARYFQPLVPLSESKEDIHNDNELPLNNVFGDQCPPSTVMYHQRNTENISNNIVSVLTESRVHDVLVAPSHTQYATELGTRKANVAWPQYRTLLFIAGAEDLAPTPYIAVRPHVLPPGAVYGDLRGREDQYAERDCTLALRPWMQRRIDTRFLRPELQLQIRLLERLGWNVALVLAHEWAEQFAKTSSSLISIQDRQRSQLLWLAKFVDNDRIITQVNTK